ncbi:hypothetical protein B296_00026046 [Ensete ventricosum]|uniref:Uncharacterized protein n=1 Tax=Ensete ventricosum TaxID=4639 RepID=A0A426YH93_ENSVE|nr:hypothetical protein B296_00026046 [Ensete ventricosum]
MTTCFWCALLYSNVPFPIVTPEEARDGGRVIGNTLFFSLLESMIIARPKAYDELLVHVCKWVEGDIVFSFLLEHYMVIAYDDD